MAVDDTAAKLESKTDVNLASSSASSASSSAPIPQHRKPSITYGKKPAATRGRRSRVDSHASKRGYSTSLSPPPPLTGPATSSNGTPKRRKKQAVPDTAPATLQSPSKRRKLSNAHASPIKNGRKGRKESGVKAGSRPSLPNSLSTSSLVRRRMDDMELVEGNYELAWVRVDVKGGVVDEDAPHTMWWPSKVRLLPSLESHDAHCFG